MIRRQEVVVDLDRRQQGTVLITVIMMVALAALIVTDMSYRQKMDVNRTAALLSRDQAFQYLLGAEELANISLVEDLKSDRKNVQNGEPIIKDTLDEFWAKDPNPFPVPGGMIKGKLVDLQSRFNINSIIASNEQMATKQRARLRTLFINQEIPSDEDSNLTAQILIDRMVDWMDSDQEPTGFDGREDLDYLTEAPPYRAGNQLMLDVSELVLIEGFTPEDVSKLVELVSFLPPDTALNMNTALPEVLDALFQTDGIPYSSVQFIKDRQLKNKLDGKPGFSTEQDILDVLTKAGAARTQQTSPVEDPNEADVDLDQTGNGNTGQRGGVVATNIEGNFSVNSEYFLVEAEAVINNKPVLMRSVIYRPDLNKQEGLDGDSPGSNGAGSGSNRDSGSNPNSRDQDLIRVKTLLRKLEDPLKRV